MNRPVEHLDDWLVYVTATRLNPTTRKAWEIIRENKEIPTFEQIETFMIKRILALSAVDAPVQDQCTCLQSSGTEDVNTGQCF